MAPGMDDFKLRCVKVFGHPETRHLLQQTFQSLQEDQLNPTWFTEDECFTVKQREKESIYIFDVFEGDAFDHITSLGNRILGPMCILTSKECQKNIPKCVRPVYNLAMDAVIACCTNIDKSQREKIHSLVERMGGKYRKDFTEEVTHLIANTVGGAKYQVAASFNKRIMTPEWVDKVWEKSKLEPVHGDDDQFEVYKCPIFQGLMVTVSGLGTEERKEVKKLVEKEGGKYSGEMRVKECTHLITNEPKGQKYQFALKWDIAIVRSEWLYESIEKGSCQEEAKYGLQLDADSKKGYVDTSTPERRSAANGLADLSGISMISMVNVNETNATAMSINTTAMTTMIDLDPLDDLDVTKEAADLFLDGCKIYLSGVKGASLDKLRKIINSGGATRCNQISDNVTHMVVGEKVEGDLEQIKSLASRPHVVNCQWLVECFRQERQVEETEYVSSFVPPPAPTTPDMKGVRKQTRVQKAAQSTKDPDETGAGEEEMQDIMSQYLGDRDVSNDTIVAPGDEDKLLAADKSITSGKTSAVPDEDEDDMTQDPDETTAMDTTSGGIFHRKSFVLLGFVDEDVPVMATFIKENGGAVLSLNVRRIPDYAVVPFDGFQVERTVKEIVTNVWLQTCIEENTLLDIHSNPLFTPLEFKEGQSLSGCVMSISGYAGTERDCLTCIVQMLGGTVQDYFVRKARGKHQPSSHLIVNAPEGSKYNAAKNWGIPALAKEWLLACARSGVREPEEPYLIDTIWLQKSHDQSQMSHDQTRKSDQTQSSSVQRQSEQEQKLCYGSKTADHIASGDLGYKSCDQIAQNSDNKCASSDAETLKRRRSPDVTGVGNSKQRKNSKRADGDGRLDSYKDMLDNSEKGNDKAVGGEKDCGKNDGNECIQEPMDTECTGATHDIPAGPAAGSLDSKVPSGNIQSETGDTPRFTRYVRKMNQNPPPVDTPPLAMSFRDRNKQKGPMPLRAGWGRKPNPTGAATTEGDVSGNLAPGSLSQKENVSAPVQNRVQELRGASADDKDTPSKFLNPNVRYHPQFDTAALLEALKTPEDIRAARAKRRESDTPLEELFSQMLDKALENMEKRKQEKEQQSQRSQDEVDGDADAFQESSSVLQGVIITVAKKLCKDQADLNEIVASLGGDYRWNYDKSCTHFIYQGRQNDRPKDLKIAKQDGAIIVSPHWLYKCQEQNARLDEGLYPHTYNPNLTLSVVSTRRTPARTPARNLRSIPAFTAESDPSTSNTAVNEEPVKSTDKNKRSPKGDNPVSPKRIRLSPRGGNTNTPKGGKRCSPRGDNASQRTPTSGRDKSSSEDENKSMVEVSDDGGTENGGSLEMREMLSRQLENVMAECKGKKRKSRRLNCGGTPEDLSGSGSRQTRRTTQVSESTPKTRSSRSGTQEHSEKNSAEMAPSQSVHVVWDDPMGRMEQEKLAHKLERACSPTQESLGLCGLDPGDAQFSDTEGETELAAAASIVVPPLGNKDKDKVTPKMVRQQSDKTPTPEAPSLAFPTTTAAVKVTPPKPVDLEEDQIKSLTPVPIFMMSGMSQAERDDYGALIEQLGGQVLDTQQFDDSCTHLVVGKIARNEKFLACIAAGKWVLHKSYFEACRQERRFVKEDVFEWGSEGTLSLCKNMESNLRQVAAAARDWRVRLQDQRQNSQGRRGAFQNWRVILCCQKSREGNYRRLLEAGGAVIVNEKPPFKRKVDASHALLELQKVALTQSDLETLLESGCLCLRPEYISAHLADPQADISDYCPEEVKALQQR